MGSFKPIRIVIVGPTDVNPEKDFVDAAVLRMADGAARRGFTLVPIRWERLPPRASPEGVQAGIEDDLQIEDCDVVVALLWKKYGVPDDKGYSPTAREIRKALAANRASGRKRPAVKVYFSKKPFAPAGDDLKEYEQIVKFKKEISAEVRYKEYERPDDFNLQIREDLGKLLDDLTFAERTWSCTATSDPVVIRNEGFTERVGEIHLTLQGPGKCTTSGKVNLQVTVLLDTFLSSRLYADETRLDITLAAETDGNIWQGRTRSPQTNAVAFDLFSRAAPDAGFDDTFVIEGIRIGSAGPGGGRITALVEVVISDNSGAEIATARARTVLALTAKSTFFVATAALEPRIVLEGSQVQSVLLGFESAFRGTFMTQQEEAGWRAGGSSYGTVLAAYFPDLPKEWELYATLYDLSFDTTGGRAVATRLNEQLPNGRRTPSKLFWDGLIPMVQIERGQCVAWEVVGPGGFYDLERTSWEITGDLAFGIALVGKCDIPPIESISVSGWRAPSFAASLAVRTSSATLPIPRFMNLNPPWTIRFL